MSQPAPAKPRNTGPLLSAEQAETVRRANIANILKAQREGRPLTSLQLRLIEANSEFDPNRRTSSVDLTFESMNQASHWFAPRLDVSQSRARRLLREAKKAGLPGFRGSRVQATELLPALTTWLREKEHVGAGSESKDELDCRRLRGLCQRIEFQNSVERGEFVAVSAMAALVTEIESRTTSLLRQKLENEFPVSCAGQEVGVVRVFGKRLVDDICAQRRQLWQRHEAAASSANID